MVDNLVDKLCGILSSKNQKGETREWRLLGQEKDGNLLFTWIYNLPNLLPVSQIGIYSHSNNSLKIIYTFDTVVNTIQASINFNKTLLCFVTKDVTNEIDDDDEPVQVYKPYIVEIGSKKQKTAHFLGIERSKQIMLQFLYRKSNKMKEKNFSEKFLLFVHQESISLYHVDLENINENGNNYEWVIKDKEFKCESVVRVFVWAQWEPVHQSLFYIHYRKPTRCLVEGEEQDNIQLDSLSPTLSGLQFHDELPHETVLNIPLNLPQLPNAHANRKPCGIYQDDTVPLRVHDCSLDLLVVVDPKGVVCICHHYLYQPVKPALTDQCNQDLDAANTVHLAYSITLLHHGCVLHCVIPGIQWTEAKMIRPTFALHGDHHMIVFMPGLFTHLLDIGVNHEPMCHILTSNNLTTTPDVQLHLVPLLHCGKNATINLTTLDIVQLSISLNELIETFRTDTSVENRIAILHYLLIHQVETDRIAELISILAEKPMNLGTIQILKEMLIGGAYASSQRNLSSDAIQLVNLLPISTSVSSKDIEGKINKVTVRVSQEVLWNTAMMLLSPQQRLVPYRGDMWTRLWEQLARIGKAKTRFKPSQVTDKLMISLACYQPEALSRSSTPLSPGGALVGSSSLADLAAMTGQSRKGDYLPFHEMESCTASKQEHIISVNLRELSMHLLKQTAGAGSTLSRSLTQPQTPMHVHAVATRYVAAQLELSKHLCHLLCRCAGLYLRHDSDKGFILIDQLDDGKKYILFTLLERYFLAVDSIAFPLPQGFTSFFTFLGYRTLAFNTFMQYVKRNVFELQVDVMKIIMKDIDDTKENILKKLKLLSLLPRQRAKRLLNQWGHPVSLMLRAREHALNILSGVEGQQPRGHALHRTRTNQLGLAAFPSADRLSPLDTFLDLLTAKASLAELDFGLLIEATVTSTEEFL